MALRFHLAGINNQNFLMRDEQTGTYWQQITGLAIAGPLTGRRLVLVSADELSFKLWKAEEPAGTVLRDVPRYTHEYAPENWDVDMARMPVVISYAQAGIKPRDLMIGVAASGVSRAYPYKTVLQQKLIEDHLGAEPVMLLVGPDNTSVRVFRRRLQGVAGDMDFYHIAQTPDQIMDASTGSHWNFEGCAVDGRFEGQCLDRIESIKDYWFDWRNYHPDTSVYGVRQRIH